MNSRAAHLLPFTATCQGAFIWPIRHLVRCSCPTGPFSCEISPRACQIPLYGPSLCLGHLGGHRHPIPRADARSDALRVDEVPCSDRPCHKRRSARLAAHPVACLVRAFPPLIVGMCFSFACAALVNVDDVGRGCLRFASLSKPASSGDLFDYSRTPNP